MKKFLFALLLCIPIFTNGQVEIHNANSLSFFKLKFPNQIYNNNLLDTIAILQAGSVLKIENQNIDTLEGLKYFKSLQFFYCNNNNIKYISSLPPNIQSLELSNNQLDSLPLLPTKNLFEFTCSNNNLTSLPKLPQTLVFLDCGYNNIQTLPILPEALSMIVCPHNQLSTLPNLPLNLGLLNISNNKFSSLPKLPNNLTMLDFTNNNITSLEGILPDSLKELSCGYNSLKCIPYLNSKMEYLHVDSTITCVPNKPDKMQISIVSKEEGFYSPTTVVYLIPTCTYQYNPNSCTVYNELPESIHNYPNPSNSIMNFTENGRVTIYSSDGTLKIWQQITDNMLEISSLNPGIYYYQLFTNSQKLFSGNFIKQ